MNLVITVKRTFLQAHEDAEIVNLKDGGVITRSGMRRSVSDHEIAYSKYSAPLSKFGLTHERSTSTCSVSTNGSAADGATTSVCSPEAATTICSPCSTPRASSMTSHGLPESTQIEDNVNAAEVMQEISDGAQRQSAGTTAELQDDHIVVSESSDLPSIGSAEHHLGRCKPCCFFRRSRCLKGVDCHHCHVAEHKLPARPGKQTRDRMKLKAQKAALREEEARQQGAEQEQSVESGETQETMYSDSQEWAAWPQFYAIPVYAPFYMNIAMLESDCQQLAAQPWDESPEEPSDRVLKANKGDSSSKRSHNQARESQKNTAGAKRNGRSAEQWMLRSKRDCAAPSSDKKVQSCEQAYLEKFGRNFLVC